MERKRIHVTHLHASRYNVGDDAIVMATYELVRRELPGHEVRFTDIARDEFVRDGEPVDGFIPLYECHRPRYWAGLVRALVRSNAVMIGGGELIRGGIDFLWIALLAKLIGRPVVFYGVGVDMREATEFRRRFTRWALRFVDRIVVRDEGALAELEALGVPMERVVPAADIVLTLDPSPDLSVSLPRPPAPGGGITLGVSLRSQIAQDRRFGEEELARVAAALDHVVEEHDANVVFFPFLGEDSPYEQGFPDDPFATDTRIMERCRGLMRRPERAVVYEGTRDPRVLMALFSRLDAMVAMRLHASILAANAGLVPIALNYSRKVERVIGMLGAGPALIDLRQISGEVLDERIRLVRSGVLDEPARERRAALREDARRNVSSLADLLLRRRTAWTPVLLPALAAGLVLQAGWVAYVRTRNPLLLRVLSLRRRLMRAPLAAAVE